MFLFLRKRRILVLYLNALSNEENTYNRARIITLIRGLVYGSILYIALIILSIINSKELSIVGNLPYISLTLFGIWLCNIGKWRICIHVIMLFITLQNLASYYIANTSEDILFVQQITLSLLISNFLLDYKKGTIYSIVNMGIAVIYFKSNRTLSNSEFDNYTIFTFIYTSIFTLMYIWSFFEVVKKNLIRNEKINIKKKKLFKELQISIQREKKLAKSKTDFLSNMTHELRTPLNSVIGFSNLLLQENLTNSQKENLNILLFSAENLFAIINNILDFNKLDVEKIELEKFEFNIAILLDKIYLDANFKAQKKNIQLFVNYSNELKTLIICGDTTRITQVLYNLIDNAIKFTEEGQVNIEVSIVSQNSENVTLAFNISDTGIGIDLTSLERIFKPFEQAEANTTRKFGGTGLGLSIVNKLIELHNSKLNCVSELGKGTTFSFSIQYPISKLIAHENLIEKKPNFNENLENLKILLVEDNSMNILLMSKLFTNWKIRYQIANDGKIGVERALAQTFDLIFMDINMPVMDGIEASTIIKKHKPEICIVALTANTTNYEESTTYKDIFDHYISKPIIQDKLYNLLKTKNKLIYGQDT